MNPIDRIESLLMAAVDAVFARRRVPRPEPARLAACRLVSHRGEHDNRRCFENTLAAFDAAARAGVWGIEFDLRWTQDRVPVVLHDPDLKRVFGKRLAPAAATAHELRRACPEVPLFAEVVRRYGGRMHLMIEVKAEAIFDPPAQGRAIAEILAPLRPGTDYHFMSLDPRAFSGIPGLPRAACIPIARFDCRGFARLARREGYAGIAGHYLLVSRALIEELHAGGLAAGTGYSQSLPVLYRELNRGVDWVFSNRAAWLARRLDRMAQSGSASSAACARPFSSSTK